MAHVQLTLDEYEALRSLISSERESEGAEMATKPKKKVSKYHREFGRQQKALVLKHPRTSPKDLMAKAHSLTRKALGMPKKTSKK